MALVILQFTLPMLGFYALDRILKGKYTAEQFRIPGYIALALTAGFQLFDLLAQNAGIVVPRDIILDRIWGLESDVSSNNIDSYMKILRKKLDVEGGKSLIKTVRGVGYKLEADAPEPKTESEAAKS